MESGNTEDGKGALRVGYAKMARYLVKARYCKIAGYALRVGYAGRIPREGGILHEGLGVPYALTNGCKWPHGAVRVPRNRKVHAHPPPHRACTGVGRESVIILIGFEHPVVPQGESAEGGAFEYNSGESAILGPRPP